MELLRQITEVVPKGLRDIGYFSLAKSEQATAATLAIIETFALTTT